MQGFTKFIFIFSLILIGLCVLINVATYFLIPSPVFENLISARILGKNETDTFLEMIWEINSNSYFAYIIDYTELYLVEEGNAITKVNTDNNINVNPYEVSLVKMTATINNAWFAQFAGDPRELYPFNIQGNVVTRVLFFYKVLNINQILPIKLKLLVNDFLVDSFKNSLMIESVRISDDFVECNLNIVNRSMFDLDITEFSGSMQINNNLFGTVNLFTPVSFLNHETRKTGYVRFITNRPAPQNLNNRYFIEGHLKVHCFNFDFIFPISIIGQE